MSRADTLRRIWNPPNPWLSRHSELLEPEEAETEIFEDTSRSILSRNDSPDLHFRWSVNPYRGCSHACAYCYARPTHEYLGFGAGTDFDRKILVKPRAPELLRRELGKRSWRGELVVFSGATDCYQPLEATWKLTRACLEVCAELGNPVSVITKSALVLRDSDLLASMAERGLASVAVSIPFLRSATCRAIEPGAPAPARRFEVIRRLAAAGVPVGVAVAPIIPGLNDSDIPGILRRARESGASSAFRILLRMPGSAHDVFFRRLHEQMPERAAKVGARIREARGGKERESRFGRRFVGTGVYWETLDDLWAFWIRRLGYRDWKEGAVPVPEGALGAERADAAPRTRPGAGPASRRLAAPPTPQLDLWGPPGPGAPPAG
ncbi:MAG: PA0069 family radical SAM protein [Gemmatimonadetes bacterium]|nr:PA0069 family radical SAM protein [Gemmatimonadota bacterium]